MIKNLLSWLTGEMFRFYIGGGGGGQQQQQPTTQTVQQTNLPAWAQPYSEQLLGQAQALTNINQNPYQSYQGQRLADFTPMQQQAFQNIGGMQVAPQTGQATGLAGVAGLGGLGAGQQYAQMATDPNAVAQYMSPYMQNVVDYQKQQAIRDYSRALPGLGAQAAQAGAFGGSRQALVESEAQRNLQNQLAGIGATGAQNAFQQAQQAQQFGAGLGMQGLGLAGQAAQTLGQLGQQQYGQQMGINAALQQAGAQQQALAQQGLTNQYQDYLNRMNYPYQQLAFMSDILHGTPTGGITTAQQYQAAPSMANQIMGYGLGAYGLSKLFGKEGGSVPGGLKKYAKGGEVKYNVGGAVNSIEAQYQDALKMGVQRLQDIIENQTPSEISPVVAAAALKQLQQEQTAAQGMQAQQELAREPGTVLDRMKAQQLPQEVGVETLDTDNLKRVVAKASGGIIGFAGPTGSFVGGDASDPLIPETEEQLLRRRLAIGDVIGETVNRGLQGLGAVTYPIRGFASDVMSLGSGLGRMVGLPVGMPERQPIKAIRRPVPQSQYNAQNLAESYVSGVGDKAKTAPAVTRKTAPAAAPAVSKRAPELVFDQGPSREMPAPTGTPAEQQGIGAITLPTIEQEMQRAKSAADIASQYTEPEMKAVEELVSKRRASAESETAKRKGDALGLGALFAAGELLQSGRTGATSLGEAFKVMGKQGVEFTKEEQRIKDKLDDADLALAQAKLSFKKGNLETGTKLVESHEKRVLEAADLAGKTAYQKAIIESQNKGHSIDQARLNAQIAQFNAEQPFKNDLWRAQAAHFRASAARDPYAKLESTERLKAIQESIAANKAIIASAPYSPEAKKARENLEKFTQMLAGKTGLGVLPTKKSIQLESVNPADIVE
jgi:hypothetical protein